MPHHPSNDRFPLCGRVTIRIALFAALVSFQAWPAQIQEAAQLFEKGKLPEAEEQARAALATESTRPMAYAILGAIRLQQKKYDESAEFLERALRLNPDLTGVRLNLGNVYVLQGRSALACAAFRQVLKLHPTNFDAQFALARLENEAGHYTASEELTRPIAAALRRSDDGLLMLVSNSLGRGDVGQARTVLADWRKLPHPRALVAIQLADLLEQHQLLSDAIAVLEQSKSGGASLEVYSRLGSSYFQKGQFPEAVENYERALSVKPDCAACWLQLGRIAEKQANLEQALAFLMNAKRISPRAPEILAAMGRVCLKQDLYTDAIENLSAAVKLQPDNESYSYMLASALVGKQRYKDAIPLLTRSLSHHPEDPVLNYSVGAVEFLNQDLVEAERHLRLSLRYRQDQVGAHYYLALLEERKGNPDGALGILRTLAKNYPDHAPTFVALGTTLVQAGNYWEAKQALDRALQLDSSSVKAHYQLGIVLARLGDREGSKKEFALVDMLKANSNAKPEVRIVEPEPQ